VNIALERPYGTVLFISIASSTVLNFVTNNIGQNNSSLRIGASLGTSMKHGYTQFPG